MTILKSIPTIEVPHWATITEGRYVTYSRYENNCRKRYSIGVIVPGLSENGKQRFQPNSHFKNNFPTLFYDSYGDYAFENSQFISGVYATFLKLAAACGLYQVVQRCFGADSGNLMMDYAMMCFASKENSVYQISNFVANHMHFSVSSVNATKLTTLLTKHITDSMIVNFKNAWMQEYIKNNDVSEVWLSIDGTNNDSKMIGSALAAKGHPKSGKSVDIIGQIWAIDCSNGMPITWDVVEGNVPDCKSFDLILAQLKGAGIKVKGVLLDRGFATNQIMQSITDLGLEYSIMLKGSCNGYDEMYSKFGQEICRNVRRLISNDGLYGCTSKVKVFNNGEPTNVGLFYHNKNATDRAEHLNTKVFDNIQDAQQAIQEHQTPKIDPRFKKIISIANDEHGQPEAVEVNFDKWQELFNSKGFFAIATSLDLTAAQMYPLHAARNTCENAFTQVKSMLGFKTLRGHTDASVEARIAVSFISSIVRASFVQACEQVKVPSNLMLGKLERVCVAYSNNNGFQSKFSGEKSVRLLFNELGLSILDLSDLANQMTKLHCKVNMCEYRTLISFEADGIKTESDMHHMRMQEREIAPAVIVKKEFEDIPVKRRPGRPKGSKNKKTLERESVEGVRPPTAHGKRGRPKGSKNKKTLEREAAEALLPPKPPAKIGRPKGSKNKKTLEREAAEALLPPKPPAKRGRPKGSKNKKTLEREAAQALLASNSPSKLDCPEDTKSKMSSELDSAETLPQPKPQSNRGVRGRPNVSKNKMTLERDTAPADLIQSSPESLLSATGKAEQVRPVKRGPGRPKGSLNKKTLAFQEKIALEFEKERRSRSRSRGSKRTTSG